LKLPGCEFRRRSISQDITGTVELTPQEQTLRNLQVLLPDPPRCLLDYIPPPFP
jgi:hypothetical protein